MASEDPLKQMPSNSKLSLLAKSCILLPTIIYWWWESQAEGNIRVDLLIIYPVLFCSVHMQLYYGNDTNSTRSS